MASPVPVPPREAREDATAPAQIFLQPIAPPSILGLYGFAGATFIVAAHMAGWFGDKATFFFLAPFCAIFGGVAQFTAGMWAFKARDGLATAMHGMWGSFWIAFGLLQVLIMTHVVTPPAGAFFPAFGYWFVALAAITWMGAWAASAENKALFLVLATLAAGSTAAAISDLTGIAWVTTAAGYLFIVSAIVAWYTASAMMLAGSFGRSVLPVGKSQKLRRAPLVMPGRGEAGVIHGQ